MLPDSQMQQLVSHAPLMITAHSTDGRILYASPASLNLLGYTPEALAGTSIYDYVHLTDRDLARKFWSQVQPNGKQRMVEYRIRRQQGDYLWCRTVLRFSSSGRILAYTQDISQDKILEEALQVLAKYDHLLNSSDWFKVLVSHLTTVLKISYAFITQLDAENARVNMLAFWKGSDFGTPYAYPLQDTPCNLVIQQGKLCHHPVGVQVIYPKDRDLLELNAQGYLGVPIFSLDRRVIGHLALLDNKPLKFTEAQLSIVQIFAIRAGIELERLKGLQN
jgi:PAS domain S-box-containing protein